MIDLSKLDPAEAERIAYAEGFTGVAALYARLGDAEVYNDKYMNDIDCLEDQVRELETQTTDREDVLEQEVIDLQTEIQSLKDELEELRGTLYQCLPFFEDWKDEDGVYKARTMQNMIQMIRKSLGEALK